MGMAFRPASQNMLVEHLADLGPELARTLPVACLLLLPIQLPSAPRRADQLLPQDPLRNIACAGWIIDADREDGGRRTERCRLRRPVGQGIRLFEVLDNRLHDLRIAAVFVQVVEPRILAFGQAFAFVQQVALYGLHAGDRGLVETAMRCEADQPADIVGRGAGIDCLLALLRMHTRQFAGELHGQEPSQPRRTFGPGQQCSATVDRRYVPIARAFL